jgi:hypothetical protein
MKKHATEPYNMLHIDFKHVGIRSWGGAVGFSTIVDDFSRRIHVLPLASKSDFTTKFKEFANREILSRGYKINIIRCDNGSEIKNFKFSEFMTVLKARFEFTSTYSPESDGVAERAHQTILSIANTMRIGGNLPPESWAELINTATFVHAMLPCKSNLGNISPFQAINKFVPDVSFLRIIGCDCYVHKHKPQRQDVLDTRASKGQLLGYAIQTKGYRVLMSTSPLKIIETMHVTFAEALINTPTHLLSLPDRAADHYFAQYPESQDHMHEQPQKYFEESNLHYEEENIRENKIQENYDNLNLNITNNNNSDMGAVENTGQDHILSPEAEIFLSPVLRNKKKNSTTNHIPPQRDPYPIRSRGQVMPEHEPEHANMARHRAHAVRNIQAATKNIFL